MTRVLGRGHIMDKVLLQLRFIDVREFTSIRTGTKYLLNMQCIYLLVIPVQRGDWDERCGPWASCVLSPYYTCSCKTSAMNISDSLIRYLKIHNRCAVRCWFTRDAITASTWHMTKPGIWTLERERKVLQKSNQYHLIN